jgi:hypothetical protein
VGVGVGVGRLVVARAGKPQCWGACGRSHPLSRSCLHPCVCVVSRFEHTRDSNHISASQRKFMRIVEMHTFQTEFERVRSLWFSGVFSFADSNPSVVVLDEACLFLLLLQHDARVMNELKMGDGLSRASMPEYLGFRRGWDTRNCCDLEVLGGYVSHKIDEFVLIQHSPHAQILTLSHFLTSPWHQARTHHYI